MLEIINKNSKTSPERIKSMLSENNAFCTLCRRYLKIRYGSDLAWHLQMMMLDSRIVSVLQESYSRHWLKKNLNFLKTLTSHSPNFCIG